jgi:integrase
MLMLSWLTGMRVGELASLKMGDVLTPAVDVRTVNAGVKLGHAAA